MSPYFLLAVNIVLGVVGQSLIKLGVNRLGGGIEAFGLLGFLTRAVSSPFVVSGMGCYAFSSVLWVILLSKLDLSIAYPALSLGYILILLVSTFFLGEHVSSARFAGVLLIMVGIAVVFRS